MAYDDIDQSIIPQKGHIDAPRAKPHTNKGPRADATPFLALDRQEKSPTIITTHTFGPKPPGVYVGPHTET